MNFRRPRHIRRLLWRARHDHHDRINGRKSSFNESLINGQRSDGRWGDPDSEEVPRGFLPVYVGMGLDQRRFIVPMAYLSMPEFRELMERAAEEFGFEQEGGLKIPCGEEDFEEILYKCLAKHKAMSQTRRKFMRP